MVREYLRNGLAGLMCAGMAACISDGSNIQLPSAVSQPEIYIIDSTADEDYVLAESEEQGCILTFSGPWPSEDEYREVIIYSGKDCENISSYLKVLTNWDLERIVRQGEMRGRILEKASLESVRLTDDEASNILERYEVSVERIRKKHFAK